MHTTKAARRSVALALAPLLLLAAQGCKKSGTGPPAVSYSRIDAATAGSVEGTVYFSGEAPPPAQIEMTQDPGCGKSGLGANFSEQYAVRNGRMANVFVFVKDGLGNKVYAAPSTPVVLDQKGCRYAPHVIGVMAGQPVEFRNSDPTTHNVNVQPAAAGDADFNADQSANGAPVRHIFAQPETMIAVRCNYHPWMQAYINVVSNPFYAVSGGDGRYEIRGLPPGVYTLAAEQEKLGGEQKTVTVKSHETSMADFTFQSPVKQP